MRLAHLICASVLLLALSLPATAQVGVSSFNSNDYYSTSTSNDWTLQPKTLKGWAEAIDNHVTFGDPIWQVEYDVGVGDTYFGYFSLYQNSGISVTAGLPTALSPILMIDNSGSIAVGGSIGAPFLGFNLYSYVNSRRVVDIGLESNVGALRAYARISETDSMYRLVQFLERAALMNLVRSPYNVYGP